MNINRAIKEAKKSDHDKYKHATLLFRGSVLVAAGYNQGKKHSEIMALNKVKHKGGAAGLIAFNVRIHKIYSNPEMSRPCKNCSKALDKAGVTVTYYTTGDNTKQIDFRVKGELG